ncbi:hypothetical protein HW555_014263 [Spodoptera exigua]|uniref:FAD/NAD(P)-binding domain-containing protein n=1 Tax=Spodoptera exigua TaxID=7107 RepID=A0A835G1T1_SPOEX|nr:hypothetical protein HW555_014263 [Spodoptera exigua]
MNHLIDELDQARYTTLEQLVDQGVEVLLNTDVTKINAEKKIIICEGSDERVAEVKYDKLILATGSNQFSTNMTLPSEDKVTVFKNYPSSVAVLERLETSQTISIIGGGYIGVELCDALKDKGKEIHLIESADSLLFRYEVLPMKAEEKKFYDFIMDRTKAEHQEDMKHLLAELMERRTADKLDKMYLMSVVPRALSYLDPDAVNEVKKAVSEFSAKL